MTVPPWPAGEDGGADVGPIVGSVVDIGVGVASGVAIGVGVGITPGTGGVCEFACARPENIDASNNDTSMICRTPVMS